MTAQDIYSRLVELRNASDGTLYERLKLADELLSNSAWVLSPNGGGGSEGSAVERLEDAAFGDLAGAMSLADLLELLHHFPKSSEWKSRRFHLRRMQDEMRQAQREARKPQTKTADMPAQTGGAEEPVQRRKEEPDAAASFRALRQENTRLREQVQTLERENRRLRRVLKRVVRDVGQLQEVA